MASIIDLDARPDPRREKVLVVDDEPFNRKVLGKLLGQLGYDFEEAASGTEAVEVVDEKDFDLLLLDIQMPPGISGLETLKILREKHDATSLPIVMVTAEDSSENVVGAFKLGANDYVTKPIDPEVTIARIETQIKLRQAQRALRDSEERYALAAQGANDGLWDWNLITNEIYYSPRWFELLDAKPGELSTPESWFSRIHAEDRTRVETKLNRHLQAETPYFESELRVRHNSGEYRWMLCRGQAIRDKDGVAHRIAGSLTDINEGKVADAVTGLPNRVLFLDRVQRCVDQLKRKPDRLFAVMFTDLDNFKLVNDGLGHEAGDELLTAVAKRLETSVRSAESVVARIGGDEFAILLEDINEPEDAFRIAERVLREFAVPFRLRQRDIYVTMSVGISLSSSDFNGTEDLVHKADTAMYQAKEQGKSCYRIFDPDMQERVSARLKMESDLRRAIERSELFLNFQPIVSIETGIGQVVGFETLARWQHPESGLISPSEFVPIAEDTGQIIPIDYWAIKEACHQLKSWQSKSPEFADIFVSLNVSRRQILHSDLVSDIREIIAVTEIKPEHLHLEITESTVMHDAQAGAEVLANLQKLGVRIAIDDFGTGYSSLACLHRLPLDTLKIDQSFVDNLSECRENRAIIRTIVRLAESLNLAVVAEGIETREQRDLLTVMGCQRGQGFLFSRPLTADDAFEFLVASRPATRVGSNV